jgi:hypothetical protein
MTTMEQVQPARQSNPLRALVKFILFVIVKILAVLLGFWRRYPLPALIVLVMAIGTLFALGSGTLALPGTPAAAPVPEARVAVETYIIGQKEYNADLMWQAMDDQLKAALQQRQGVTLDALKQQQQQRRQAGVKLSAKHVAGTDLDDGRKVFLYIFTESNGQATQQVPYTFTVNKAGKIIGID